MKVDATRERILKFATEYFEKHGYMPTARELAEDLTVSQNTIKYHLNVMLELGIFETDLQTKNAIGDSTHVAWTTRGYRFRKD